MSHKNFKQTISKKMKPKWKEMGFSKFEIGLMFIPKFVEITLKSLILVGNEIDNSPIVGASPVAAAPTISSFRTWYMASVV